MSNSVFADFLSGMAGVNYEDGMDASAVIEDESTSFFGALPAAGDRQDAQVEPTDAAAPPPKRRKRRTPEEMAADAAAKAEQIRIRQAKAKQRDETKQQKANDKHYQKQQKEEKQLEEKRRKEKRALAAQRQRSETSDCDKYLTTVVDEAIFPLCSSLPGTKLDVELQRLFVEMPFKREAAPLPVANSVSFRRKTFDGAADGDGPYSQFDEPEVLIVLPLREFLGRVSGKTLVAFANDLKELLPDKLFTLVTVGLEQHLSTLKNANTAAYKKAVTFGVVSKEQVTEALVDVQMDADVQHRLLEGADELAGLLYTFHRAVAAKLKKAQQWDRGNLAGRCLSSYSDVEVGEDAAQAEWLRSLLLAIPQLGDGRANAVVEAYGSPAHLCSAYAALDDATQRAQLLQDLQVVSGEGRNAAGERRLGSAMSQLIHIAFTSANPNQLLKRSV